jgi:hypothetical protein
MEMITKVYEFGASAGALEGYVYHREDVDMKTLPNWIGHLRTAYGLFPENVLKQIQPSIDQTLGRALRSLVSLLGKEHELVLSVKAMTKGPIPDSPDTFQKRKWFEE